MGDREMNKTISYLFAITMLTIFFTFNTADAGGRIMVYEMGESGVTIEFPMTPEEIAGEDAAYVKVAAESISENVKVFEMGEGGHTVAFPMTADEITVANAENARLVAVKAVRLATTQEPVVRFKLAESGHIIEFSESVKETELGDLVIAYKNP
jgi:hypothetical protein